MIENLWIVLVVIAICTYLAVKSWANARRAEREALYRSETLKKFAEMQGTISDPVLQVLREAVRQVEPPPSSINYDYNREREAFYRSEMVKKIAETGGGSAAAMEFIREDDRKQAQHARHAFNLGGMITFAAGVGLMIFLRSIIKEEPVYLVSLVPMLVGAVLVVYALAFAPRD